MTGTTASLPTTGEPWTAWTPEKQPQILRLRLRMTAQGEGQISCGLKMVARPNDKRSLGRGHPASQFDEGSVFSSAHLFYNISKKEGTPAYRCSSRSSVMSRSFENRETTGGGNAQEGSTLGFTTKSILYSIVVPVDSG